MRFLLPLLLLILPISLFAQQDNKYPVEFGQFMKTSVIYNPASIDEHDHINLQTGLLQYIGPFKTIKTYYSTFSYQIQKKYNHTIGFNFISDREGELISRNYFYGRYVIKIPLNDQYSLSAGTTIGFVNYAFNGSTPYSIGADTKPDASIGSWLHHKKFNIGYALNQITNSTLRPIEEQFILNSFSVINADYTYQFHPNLNIKGLGLARIYSGSLYNVEMAFLVEHYKTLTWGAGYKTQRGVNFYFGLNKIPILDDRFHFMFSYFLPTFENQANRYNFFELNLSYGINSKQAK